MPIDTTTLPIFFGAVAALLIVPGPDFFFISTQAASRGTKYGVACAMGITLAGLLQTALVAGGLGRIMEVWPAVATAVRLLGAAYLAYLGLGLVRSWWRNRRTVAMGSVPEVAGRPIKQIFFAGVANNLLNPKALLFFSVFIPQFVNPNLGSPSLQIACFGLLLTALATLYNIGVAVVFGQLKKVGAKAGALARNSDGIIGVLFIILSGRLALSKAA